MKFIRLSLLVAVLATFSLTQASAQDRGNRGNFNPEQMRERMMERVREQMDVTDDADWKLISERVNRVMEARREVGTGNNMGMMFGRRGGGGGERGGEDGNRRRGPGGFGGEPSREAEALQKAIEAKASSDELKSKMAAYREAQKAKREKLAKAQDDLRKVLTVRQEAAAVMMGLLE
jgi:hypothetical protein